MYRFLRPIFFQFSPETAHHLAMQCFRIGLKIPFFNRFLKQQFTLENEKLTRSVLGLTFRNPVGLAAGFDKDGKYLDILPDLGFGFVELGTVTPRPQDGNPLPRLFRLPADRALINRMGFNNAGVHALAERLRQNLPVEWTTHQKNKNFIIGGNIGKNKDTPNDRATEDYAYCFEALFPLVDYFVVNVSSPNTPNLRDLQEKEPLTNLLKQLQILNKNKKNPKPILLKIAPDLTDGQLDDILDIISTTELDGIVATNTTLDRSNIEPHTHAAVGAGGLSGAPLRQRATSVIRYLRTHARDPKMVIIGVGGIETPEDALEKLAAGANLIQIYSGLIYAGPELIKKICKKIVENG
ncbi:MAG: hypothetical protein RL757_1436 [Bacteroidota bacterium]